MTNIDLPSRPVRPTRADLLVLPALAVIVAFLLLPAVDMVLLSLKNQALVGTGARFVGLRSVADVLTHGYFWPGLRASLAWTFGNVALQTLFGVPLGFVLHFVLRRRPGLQTLALVPWVVPTIVVGLTWRWLLATSYGVLGRILVALHLARTTPNFLGTPTSAMVSAIAVNSWHWFPFVGLMVYALLQTVPRSEIDAARVDGAAFGHIARQIILPQLSAALGYVGILGAIFAFQVFDVLNLLTAGGPANATTTLPIVIYRLAFQRFQMSHAAAAALLTLLTLAVLTSLMFLLISRSGRRRPSSGATVVVPAAATAWNDPVRALPSAGTRRATARIGVWALLAALALIILGPFYWLTVTSLEPQQALYDAALHWLPSPWTLRNWTGFLTSTDYPVFLVNSILAALGAIAITLLASLHAAYAIHRWRGPLRRVSLVTLVASYLMPPVVMIVPLFLILKGFGLINSIAGIALVDAAFSIPFSTILLVLYMDRVPPDLEQAARVEAAGVRRTLYRVVAPQVLPGIGAVIFFTLVNSWSDYTFALTFLFKRNQMTLPAGLSFLLSAYNINWALVSTEALATALPVVLIFLWLGPLFMRSLSEGAVK